MGGTGTTSKTIFVLVPEIFDLLTGEVIVTDFSFARSAAFCASAFCASVFCGSDCAHADPSVATATATTASLSTFMLASDWRTSLGSIYQTSTVS